MTSQSRPKARLLSDNGSSYFAGGLASWPGGRGMAHIRGAPHRPHTQVETIRLNLS
ncbi:MAG: hypothetical protein VX107_17555 [Pseudomonadota bacterium]|nr:hypothetical protein [Pseudomonadota bacterium]